MDGFPLPVSPFPSELSREIEQQRATLAEATANGTTLEHARILFEDEYLWAVNKPAGVYCEQILELLQRQLLRADEESNSELQEHDQVEAKQAGNGCTAHLVNRLDRDTSGVCLVAKSKAAAGAFGKLLASREGVVKSYLALCTASGHGLPAWRQQTVVTGHGRSRYGMFRVYDASDIGRALPGGARVKEMETRLEILKEVALAPEASPAELPCEADSAALPQNKSATAANAGGQGLGKGLLTAAAAAEGTAVLVRAILKTGRTHQIRLHCQHAGLPIVGDVRYGGCLRWGGRRWPWHCLHSERLDIPHPFGNKTLHLVAPPPEWLSELL